ncbi:MAG TPA: pilin [Patescibacteria group bacterium]|nr:pilin [Patescibacteria group bacterium]
MSLKLRKIFYSFVIFLLISPFKVLAQSRTELPQPLGGKNITEVATNIIETILGLVGVLALVMFIYGGILWMTSAGNEKQVKKGKDTLVWSVLGLAIIFFSYAILQFVLDVLIQ